MLDPIEGKKKFVILSHGRSGSKVLAAALNSHPQCIAFGELFHEELKSRIDATLGRIPAIPAGGCLQQYLSKEVYRSEDGIDARGFTLFYDQARGGETERLAWSYLLNRPDILVVHLQRTQLLEAWLSYEVAIRTNVWMLRVESKLHEIGDISLRVDREQLERFFYRIHAQRQWVNQAFRQHPSIVINYEADICNNFSPAINRIFRCLGLENCPVEPGLVKQATNSPNKAIENYEELKDYFSVGPFGYYFN